MKKILLIISILTFISSYSQIKIRESVKNKAVNNSKISEYDSLSNFGKQARNIDYLKFVGQDLFLPPLLDDKTKGVEIELFSVLNFKTSKHTVNPDTVYTKEVLKGAYDGYYDKKAEKIALKLDSIKINTDVYRPYTSIIVGNPNYSINFQHSREIFNKYYKIIDITDDDNKKLRSVESELNKLRFWLLTETNDTIYFDKKLNSANKFLEPFILNGFLEYHKKNYVGKKLFVFRSSEKDYEGKPEEVYIDINTGEEIMLQTGEFWNCDEVSFVNLPYLKTYSPHYILSKGNNQIKIKLGYLFKSGLLTLEELDILYNEWMQQKKERVKEKEELLTKVKNDCQKYFSKNNCEKLINGQIDIGMSKKMILYAFGNPYKTFTIKSQTGINEIYSYGGTIIFFKNEKVFAVEQYQ